ncbi:MAG: D-alanine--D-alanine ligase [Firmicutes bacterium]|jgi:D-alanine-D-alanine ligase|nr:D-alanine--D-alanine ligase [Bacillota bacterium]
MTKIKIAVVFGGRSGEHEVSLRSAASIMETLDRKRYEILPVGITREGTWIAGGNSWGVLSKNETPEDCFRATLVTDPTCPGFFLWAGRDDGEKYDIQSFRKVDVVFPVLHGPYGEDGAIQGLLEMAGLPYVGCGVMSSAVGMDKAVMKELFVQHGLPVGRYLYFGQRDWLADRNAWVSRVEAEIGYPCFVKPANLGSSVGISKAYSDEELVRGTEEAFAYDEKAIVEAFIPGREIECSVLGDWEVRASLPGEIIPNHDFYDYRTKYIDDHSELIIPVRLEEALIEEVQELAIRSFKAIDGSGMARADFFVDTENRNIFINEINTIPGFTSISMYPKLWEVSGLSYRELIEELIQIAMQRNERRKRLSNLPPI